MPNKLHGAVPLLIMAVMYWLSSLPGTPLPDDPALYAFDVVGAVLGISFAA